MNWSIRVLTRNSLLASLVKNLSIADTLPEGLEYVPGTLQVDGKTVTNTEWHTVVFHARAKLEKRFKIQRKSQEILYHCKNQQQKFHFNHLGRLKLRKWILLIQM